MDKRIAILEKDVDAIRSELALIRHDCTSAAELNSRVSRIELDLLILKGDVAQLKKDTAQVQKDVSQLQKDVSQLQKDVSQLQRDVSKMQNDITTLAENVVTIRIEMMKSNTEQSHFATKADLNALKADVKSVEANMKGWMLVIALSLMTSTFAMIYPLYGVMKAPALVKPAQAQAITPPVKAAPADVK